MAATTSVTSRPTTSRYRATRHSKSSIVLPTHTTQKAKPTRCSNRIWLVASLEDLWAECPQWECPRWVCLGSRRQECRPWVECLQTSWAVEVLQCHPTECHPSLRQTVCPRALAVCRPSLHHTWEAAHPKECRPSLSHHQDRQAHPLEVCRTHHQVVWECHLEVLLADTLLDHRDVRSDPMHIKE